MAAISTAAPDVADAGEDDRQTATPVSAGAIRGRTGQRHEQEQQHVVDGHDAADGRAMLAEGVAHERRHEVTEDRSGDAGEESAHTDEQQGAVGCPHR
jgi:hypothetical protein